MAVGPSRRQDRSIKKRYHDRGICCVLYAKHGDAALSREVGEAKKQEGPYDAVTNHAERRWWATLGNPRAIEEEANSKTLQRLEFEITDDFCTWPEGDTRRSCKTLFVEAGIRTKGRVPVYIFIMRTRVYYEVVAGKVELRGPWAL